MMDAWKGLRLPSHAREHMNCFTKCERSIHALPWKAPGQILVGNKLSATEAAPFGV
jgi:hypothetical protein